MVSGGNDVALLCALCSLLLVIVVIVVGIVTVIAFASVFVVAVDILAGHYYY